MSAKALPLSNTNKSKNMKRKLSKEEYALCNQIAERAVKECGFDKCTAYMDITICHSEAREIKLEELLNAPLEDFSHDVFGIHHYLDHDTHKLTDCFLPRYAKI